MRNLYNPSRILGIIKDRLRKSICSGGLTIRMQRYGDCSMIRNHPASETRFVREGLSKSQTGMLKSCKITQDKNPVPGKSIDSLCAATGSSFPRNSEKALHAPGFLEVGAGAGKGLVMNAHVYITFKMSKKLA